MAWICLKRWLLFRKCDAFCQIYKLVVRPKPGFGIGIETKVQFWYKYCSRNFFHENETFFISKISKQFHVFYFKGGYQICLPFFGRIISLKKSSWLCLTYSDFEYLLGRFDKLNAFSEKRYLYYYIIAGRAINFYFLIAAIFLIKINKISKINNFFLLWKQPGKLG